MEFTIFIHHEGTGYWCEVSELPGCFASGGTLTELREALAETIGLYLWDRPAELPEHELRLGVDHVCVTDPLQSGRAPSERPAC
jgi:predicted RNase H-like HicB family nuclease